MQFIELIRLHTSPVQKQRNVTYLHYWNAGASCPHRLRLESIGCPGDRVTRNRVWLVGVKSEAEQACENNP
jgi:hypothetical protein